MTTKIIRGDCRDVLSSLPADSVHCCVVSPPYWGLRSYLPDGHQNKPLELGLETTPAEYVANMVSVFQEVRRVLRADGTLWLNLGDSYATGAGKVGDCPGGGEQGERWKGKRQVAQTKNPNANLPVGPIIQPNRMPQVGLKPKDLCGIPWRVAFALQDDGWYLRSDIIWHKPNQMPESVRDRPTKAHEYVFLLTKSARYFWDQEAVKDTAASAGRVPGGNHKVDGSRNDAARNMSIPVASGRNIRTVWTIATSPFAESHFATFPPALAERCIKAGTSERGCCPACGAPWVRSVNVTYDNPGNRTTNGPRSIANHDISAGFAVRLEKRTETTGFRPSCDCPPADPVPRTVLDCFSGAGTTGLVADRLGRDAILIELNEDYADMAARRLRGDGGMFARVDLVHADDPMIPAITE